MVLYLALSALAGMLGTAGIWLLVHKTSPRIETDAFKALTEGVHVLGDTSGPLKARTAANNELALKAQGLEALAAVAKQLADAARAAAQAQ